MTRQELLDLLVVERFAPRHLVETEVEAPDMYAWERLKTLRAAVSGKPYKQGDSGRIEASRQARKRSDGSGPNFDHPEGSVST